MHFIKKGTTWLLCSKLLLVKRVLSAHFTKMLTNCHCFGCTELCSCRQVYSLTQHIKLVKVLHHIKLLILAWEREAFCETQLRTHAQVHCLVSHAGPEGTNLSPQQKQCQVGPVQLTVFLLYWNAAAAYEDLTWPEASVANVLNLPFCMHLAHCKQPCSIIPLEVIPEIILAVVQSCSVQSCRAQPYLQSTEVIFNLPWLSTRFKADVLSLKSSFGLNVVLLLQHSPLSLPPSLLPHTAGEPPAFVGPAVL